MRVSFSDKIYKKKVVLIFHHVILSYDWQFPREKMRHILVVSKEQEVFLLSTPAFVQSTGLRM